MRTIKGKTYKAAVIFLAIAFLWTGAYCQAEVVPVDKKPYWHAQIFLANQIKGIGLLDSYQEDNNNTSYLYDNALAAMALVALGNYGLAREILDTLSMEVKNTAQGAPFESYIYSDLSGNGNGLGYCGNAAWLLQAYNIYQKATSSKAYYNTQKKLADFLLSLQDTKDGGLRGSISEYWKSTEHNLVAYAALYNFSRLNSKFTYRVKADKIKKFLTGASVWNKIYFNSGPYDSSWALDVQALGPLVLGKGYAGSLSWAEKNMKLIRPLGSGVLTGFDFNADLDTIWLEGTLQMALALYLCGNADKGNYYYAEAAKAQQQDGSLLLATNQGTASQWWILQPWRAVAPTCWFIFYSLKFNPLVLY